MSYRYYLTKYTYYRLRRKKCFPVSALVTPQCSLVSANATQVKPEYRAVVTSLLRRTIAATALSAILAADKAQNLKDQRYIYDVLEGRTTLDALRTIDKQDSNVEDDNNEEQAVFSNLQRGVSGVQGALINSIDTPKKTTRHTYIIYNKSRYVG